MEPVVRRVDHVVVPVEDPDSLYALFTDTLGLPGLWPVVDLGPFRSGAVALGNAWLEIVADGQAISKHFEPRLPAAIRGIALEATTGSEPACAMLDARGLGHAGPETLIGRRPNGSTGPLVTTVVVDGLVADAAAVYLCELGLPLPAAAVQAVSERAGGGALGVIGVEEVQIGVGDSTATIALWQRLLDPIAAEKPGVWRIGDGPAVRVKQAPINGVAGLTVRVRSLDAARTALRERSLLGPVRRHGCGVHYAATHGLDVWLVE